MNADARRNKTDNDISISFSNEKYDIKCLVDFAFYSHKFALDLVLKSMFVG